MEHHHHAVRFCLVEGLIVDMYLRGQIANESNKETEESARHGGHLLTPLDEEIGHETNLPIDWGLWSIENFKTLQTFQGSTSNPTGLKEAPKPSNHPTRLKDACVTPCAFEARARDLRGRMFQKH